MIEVSKTGAADQASPRELFRFFLRLPILLYRFRLGWLLGRRFLLLTHTGRKSGALHSTVLEILRYDQSSHCCYIASGWGIKSQWYRNVRKNPRVQYTLGFQQRVGRVEQLPIERAERELRDYGSRHPTAIRTLTKFLIGEKFEGGPSQYRHLAYQVPVLQLAPIPGGGNAA